MSRIAQFQQIVDAEQYFEFFGLPYDAQFVNVNRLHILQKFSNYIKAIDRDSPDLNDEEKLGQYRHALQQAYDVFLASKPVEQKLFKVFNEKPQNVVLLTEIGTD
ncbi:nitrogenase stabilizing/protective protein [Chroococcidiopsis sp. CCALA 051]|uniref:nitrogenase-stabilizing/protective protein NifW n=1 Tax=Chroococcidiopsis sp. CCALA 051 TaxID=869949 RepID=UPI000D0CAE5D|nr:nitrogenase-stabilizing/protective protein NifW [Chroococcidiopsis sp. CCALA 051]MBE9019336.1 nitrogenase-stabilizing/protective protein NifW [Chroococcidiopsidales cyanobacterium LEGE 13417]PSM45583.1 nitrogenase stabilizing/protective protein [Chroococcidiopsis sp. CCALA 051]